MHKILTLPCVPHVSRRGDLAVLVGGDEEAYYQALILNLAVRENPEHRNL